MSGLHDLATAAGLHIDWEDARGQPQRVSDDALTAILGALGLPADSPAALAESRRKLANDSADCAFVSGNVGAPVILPTSCGKAGRAELILEDGDRREVAVEAAGSGLRLPNIDAAGYHRLILNGREIRLAIAPGDASPSPTPLPAGASGVRPCRSPHSGTTGGRPMAISERWPTRCGLSRGAGRMRSPSVRSMRCFRPTRAGSVPMRRPVGCSSMSFLAILRWSGCRRPTSRAAT